MDLTTADESQRATAREEIERALGRLDAAEVRDRSWMCIALWCVLLVCGACVWGIDLGFSQLAPALPGNVGALVIAGLSLVVAGVAVRHEFPNELLRRSAAAAARRIETLDPQLAGEPRVFPASELHRRGSHHARSTVRLATGRTRLVAFPVIAVAAAPAAELAVHLLDLVLRVLFAVTFSGPPKVEGAVLAATPTDGQWRCVSLIDGDRDVVPDCKGLDSLTSGLKTPNTLLSAVMWSTTVVWRAGWLAVDGARDEVWVPGSWLTEEGHVSVVEGLFFWHIVPKDWAAGWRAGQYARADLAAQGTFVSPPAEEGTGRGDKVRAIEQLGERTRAHLT